MVVEPNDVVACGEPRTTIGDLSRRFGVSSRTLRFYEAIGLLHPMRVGTDRFYSPRDQIRLQIITVGRRLGFSLREIGALMTCHRKDGPEPTDLHDLLDVDTISHRIASLVRQRADLDSAISELQEAQRRASEAGNS